MKTIVEKAQPKWLNKNSLIKNKKINSDNMKKNDIKNSLKNNLKNNIKNKSILPIFYDKKLEDLKLKYQPWLEKVF